MRFSKVIPMTSGGARARSGPAPDPNSYRSQNKDWVELPAAGFDGIAPDFPLPDALTAELELWVDLWAKPQAAAWDSLGLKYQVAAYVRAFLESVTAGAVSGLKTAVLRMETELGLSIAGMRQNGWRIAKSGAAATSGTAAAATKKAARRTTSGDWLTGVSVERD
jgi:hypothetical protein